MSKKNTEKKGMFFKLLLTGLFTFGIITVYNHNSATATDEYSPNTAFEDLTNDFANEENEGFEEIDFEENIASKYSLTIEGKASYYADRFHDRRTASGERFDMNDYSAAHKSLPFGTILRVTNIKNDKKTFVRINDRGPYSGSRVIDLSKRAAKDLGHLGLYKVKVEGFKLAQKKFQNSGKDYYFGMSYEKDLLCLPKENYYFIDSTSFFGDAVRKYNLAITYDPDVLLLVDASENNPMEVKHSELKYYLGKVTQNTVYEDEYVQR